MNFLPQSMAQWQPGNRWVTNIPWTKKKLSFFVSINIFYGIWLQRANNHLVRHSPLSPLWCPDPLATRLEMQLIYQIHFSWTLALPPFSSLVKLTCLTRRMSPFKDTRKKRKKKEVLHDRPREEPRNSALVIVREQRYIRVIVYAKKEDPRFWVAENVCHA